tara:strand:- start:600 stop:815 length:216 start_codon:yes stop_codon:yes gene_type:complete
MEKVYAAIQETYSTEVLALEGVNWCEKGTVMCSDFLNLIIIFFNFTITQNLLQKKNGTQDDCCQRKYTFIL